MRLFGRNCITERLKKNPKSIKKIYAQAGVDVETQNFASLQDNRIPIERVTKNDLDKKSSGIPHQGLIADVEDFKYAYLEDILAGGDTLLRKNSCLAAGCPRQDTTILFLDNLNDPQNLGGILRTAACFGKFAVVLPKHDSVDITEAVLRVAQGGENYVPVVKVANLAVALDKAKNAGYWIAGAVIAGGEDITKAKMNFPLGIVIGSEGKGIRQGLVNHLDLKLTLPMAGADLSFNAAVAAGLFCYEAARQRRPS